MSAMLDLQEEDESIQREIKQYDKFMEEVRLQNAGEE
jgi:hypothetical protein